MEDMLEVLDKGYVRLVDKMGNDLSVVNSARVSYNKSKNKMGTEDEKLINFLAREGHTSPFRHATLQFEVYAPLMVARQWWKYIIGSAHQDPFTAWNESSRRYITEDNEFYIPGVNEWRTKPKNSKQGSGPNFDADTGSKLQELLSDHVKHCNILYESALKLGVAPEQARLFLPAYGLYVRWYWTVSLQGVTHFLKQRLEHDAQKEIHEYAEAVKSLSTKHFPLAIEKLLNSK